MAEVEEGLGEAIKQYLPGISKGGPVVITGMSTFVAWKYLNSRTNPFKEQGITLLILITATLVHLILAFVMKYLKRTLSLIFSFCIFLVSGILAIELMLFVLFTQIWKLLVINVSVALLIAMVCFLNMRASSLSTLLSRCLGFRGQPQEPQGREVAMMDIGQPAY